METSLQQNETSNLSTYSSNDVNHGKKQDFFYQFRSFLKEDKSDISYI